MWQVVGVDGDVFHTLYDSRKIAENACDCLNLRARRFKYYTSFCPVLGDGDDEAQEYLRDDYGQLF